MSQGVAGLVEAELTAAGQGDLGEEAPTFFDDGGAGDIAGLQGGDGGGEVVTGEVDFVATVFHGGVDGDFGRGQSENEPVVAGVDVGKAEDVAEEGTVGFGILAVENHVRAGNHLDTG